MKRVALVAIMVSCLCVALSAQSLTIFCENDPPNQFIGPDGTLSGFTIDVVHEIQKRIGNSDAIQMVPWARGYDLIQHQPNVVLFQMTRTADRNPLFKWVGPVIEEVFALYSKSDSSIAISNLEEAKRVGSIGVYLNDVRDLILTKDGFKNLDRTDDPVINFKKLMMGRVDLMADSPDSVADLAKSAGYSVNDVKMVYPFAKSQIYIAMSLGTSDEVVAKWNGALDSMKSDGSFEKIFKKYYPNHDLPGPAITTF